jgi:CRP-like cAMP-binding protein
MESLLDLDPDLLGELPPDQFEAIRDAARVQVLRVPVGKWDPQGLGDSAYLGILITGGRLAASVGVGTRTHVEVLGPGDVGQPWVSGAAGASIPQDATWRVLQELELAVLDRRFAALTARWPVFTRALIERLVLRSRRLVFQLAIVSIPQIATRVEMIMWHFGDRWGRMTRDGVLLELPLSHELLAQVVSSQRPSVTTALTELRERGRIERRQDGTWLLHGPPPQELAPLYGQAGLELGGAGRVGAVSSLALV